MRAFRNIFVFAGLAAAGSAFSFDLGVANNFNAFIFGNATTTGGHSQGAIAVGGNWSMGYEAKQNSLPSVPFPNIGSAPQTGIYVGGNVTTNGLARVLQGNAYVKGTVTGTIDVQNGYLLKNGPSFVDSSVFSGQYIYSTNQSTAINSMSGLTLNVPDPNGVTLDLNANTLNGDQKVYFLDAAKLNNQTTLGFTGGNANSTILINVVGTSANWKWQVNPGQFSGKILWNFADATTVNVNNVLNGSVLAPYATVNQQLGNIDGTLIANSFTNSNSQELHYIGFTGNAPVPEPATIAALGVGIAAILRRRKKN